MKMLAKKLLVILSTFLLLLTSTNIFAIAKYVEDEFVNLGVVLELTAEKESVFAGEMQNIRIKNSYANPNDEDYATCKIYLTDGQNNPNSVAQLQGLVNNRIVFSCENNEDLSVTVELKEEKDQEGIITAKYLEYILPPGTSVEMELQFLVPNGISGKEQTLVLTPNVTHSEINGNIHQNDKMTENVTVKWTSEFKWENLQKTSSTNSISVNTDNKLTKDITYNFSADNNSEKTTGNIWTSAITITDTLTLPDGLSVPNNITYSDSKKEIYADNQLLYAITLPENINITDYEVSELKAENNQIKFSITMYNPNKANGILTSDFNPFDGLSTTLYSKQLNVQKDHIFTGEEKINNSMKAVFIPYSKDTDEITLNATKDISMEKDIEEVTLKKSVQPVEKGKTYIDDILKYTVTIENTGRITADENFEDTLPVEITLTEESIQSLQEQGFTVSKVQLEESQETYKISKRIQLAGGDKNTIEILAKIVTDKQTTIVNTAKYGNLSNSANIEVNKDILQLEKKQIKKWRNYQNGGYSYLSYNEHDPVFSIIGEGDRIEYEITLTNNSNKDRIVVLNDELPEASTYDGNSGKYVPGTMKLYLAGYQGQEFEQSNNNKGFIEHIQSYSETGYNNFTKTIVVNIPAKTTLTQTFIVDVPTGDDYIKILDGLRYNLGYASGQNLNDATNNIYNVIYVYDNPDINSKVYHKVEPRFYVQKGVIARNHLDDFEAGVALTNANNDLHKYAYSDNENNINDEVITFYAYFVNDSVYNLDLSQTMIQDYLPKGLEFLGLNTIENYYNNENGDLITPSNMPRFKLSPISERITTKANSYPLLFVNDGRATAPYNIHSNSYPMNSYGNKFENDTISVICNNMGQAFRINASGTLKPGQGFYILYSCKVNAKHTNGEKLENSITWNLNSFYGQNYNNYYEKARISDAINVTSYKTLNNPNLSNDGKCIDGLEGPHSISSKVTLEPEEVDSGIGERYGNICIKKVDESGEQIKLSEDDSVSFEILNESKQPLNFTEKAISIGDYRTKYAGKYYWYEETSSDTTVTTLTTNAGLSIKNLPIGTYYIRETKAPSNYELSTELVPFTIKTKYEEDEDNGLYDSDFRLLYGLGKEIKFENRYIGNKAVYIEKIDSKTKQVITHDEAKFSLYLSKEESDPIEFVKLNADDNGNHYRLATDKDSSKTTELITHNGKIQLDDLKVSTEYYIREIEAPFGYVKDSSYKTVFLTPTTKSDNISKKVSFENEKNMNDVTILKTDGEGTLITEDSAQFQLYDSNGEIVKLKKLANGENNSLYELTEDEDTELVDKIETYKGKVIIQHMPFGIYKIKEVKAPKNYVLSEEGLTLNIQSATSQYEYGIKNGRSIGNVNIVKTNTKGEIINSNNIIFRLYNSENKLVKLAYNNETTEDGRIYYVSEDETQNVYTQLTTYEGKIKIKNIPIGDYYLKEMVAPSGYSLYKEKIPFEVDSLNYILPKNVNVQNADYKFGEEEYVSTSYQKIEEKDNKENFGFGYYGKNADYDSGNYNYIVVDGQEDIVTYTLKVANISKKNYENLVLINKLPDIGDTGAVNLGQERNSEFTVKLAQDPNFELIVYDKDGDKEILTNGKDYTIKYSDNVQYTNDDWNGIDNENWYETPKDSTKSFRIKFRDDFNLYSGYSIGVTFDGNIQNNAKSGQIAWNSFGYRYYVNGTSLTPEPPKVGVKIPYEPIITKTITDNTKGTFYFDIYDSSNQEKVTTIELEAGKSAVIPAKRTINGETTGYLEEGKTYIVKEQINNIAKISNIVGKCGEVKENSFEFTYDKEQQTKVEFINEALKEGKIILTKVDKETKEHLSNAKFKLLNANGEVIKVKMIDGEYIIAENSNSQDAIEELITDKNGEIKINNLPFGTYKIKEVEAPDRYRTDAETTYTVNITPEDYIIEDGTVVNVPKQLQVDNQIIRGKVIVHHYIEGTDKKVPSRDEGEVQDETIVDVVKEPYTTEKSSEVSPNFEYVTRTDNYEGTITEETQEVTYYYKLVDAQVDTDISKTATKKITKEDEAITYEISYTAQIDKYIGDAQITIVDYLKYEIDESKSNLEGGVYNSKNNTITWTQQISGIDTFTNGPKDIEINKTIVVVYKNQDVTKNIVNKAEGKVVLPVTNQEITTEAEAETEQEYKLEINVNKIWEDNEIQALKRPEKVKIELLANGEVIKEQEITASENTSCKFSDLDKYDQEGQEIVYTLQEKEIQEGDLYFYTNSVDNADMLNQTITNTFSVPDVRIKVEANKIWEDNENIYEKRPESIEFVLYSQGGEISSEVEKQEVARKVVTKEENWSYIFENLPKYNSNTGNEIIYTIDENEVNEGDLYLYTKQIDNNTYTITNNFRVIDVKVNSKIEKNGTDKITKKDEEVNYSVKYQSEIDGYIGNAQITITDTLPYEIDLEKSDLADGKYDEKNKTIIWQEKIENIDTFKDGKKEIKLEKQIKVVYKNMDLSKKTLENKVEGKIFLDTTKQEDKVEAKKETKVDLRFNLKLDKQILEVQKNAETENIDSNKMHKVVINRKQTDSSTVKVKYSIKVKNTGTLIGEGIIEEKLPDGMKFIAEESDSKWYVEDNKIKAKTDSLNPEEEITLNIVAKWEGKDNIYGTLKNTAEITNTKNEAGIEEENIKDNKDGAILIIEIGTGGETYIIMAFAVLLLLLAIARVLYKNKRN